jgi:hypothetical protein
MKAVQVCTPRKSVLDGTADFVVNLADLPRLNEAEAREFLDSNVLTSGMELLLQQAFSRMSGEISASGIYKLSQWLRCFFFAQRARTASRAISGRCVITGFTSA